jgi:hypothetical protein
VWLLFTLALTPILSDPPDREEAPWARKAIVIRSQEKKWHVIPDQFAAFAAAKAPSYF